MKTLRDTASGQYLHKEGDRLTSNPEEAMKFYTDKQAGHEVKRMRRRANLFQNITWEIR